MRRLWRWTGGTSGGRRALLALTVAVVWAAWAVLPPWPITSWSAPCPDGAVAAVSPDGSRLLTVHSAADGSSTGPTLRVWDVAKGKSIEEATGPNRRWDWKSAPGGWFVALNSGEVQVRNAADGREQLTVHHFEPDRWWWEYAVSPDGRWLATGTSSEWRRHLVQLREIVTGRLALTLNNASEPLAFSPDARILATGFNDAAAPIRLWDVATGRELSQFGGDKVAKPIALAFSSDGGRLAAWPGIAADKSHPHDITIWDVAVGKRLATLSRPSNEGRYDRLEFSRDGRLLIVRGSGPGGFWDLSSSPPRCLDALLEGTIKLADQPIRADEYPLFSRDGSRFVVPGSGEPRSWIAYDAGTLARLGEAVFPHERLGPDPPLISPDGRWLAAAGTTELDPLRPWEEWLEAKLGQPLQWRRKGTFVHFYDLAAWADAGRVPSDTTLLAFAPDSRSVWTYSMITNGANTELQVRQIPVPTWWPPAWLFGVTAAAIALAALDWRRSRRRVARGVPT